MEPCQNASSQVRWTSKIIRGSPTPAIAIIKQSIRLFYACTILRLYTRTTVTCGVELLSFLSPRTAWCGNGAASGDVYPIPFTVTQQNFYPFVIDWSLPHISHPSDPPGDRATMAQTHTGSHSSQHRRRRPTYLISGESIIVTAQYQSLLSNPETGGLIYPCLRSLTSFDG